LENINFTKLNAKVGSFIHHDNFRYLLIRSTGASQWDAIRMKENKSKKIVECPFSVDHGKKYREFIGILIERYKQ
jgi:hypothetical protein